MLSGGQADVDVLEHLDGDPSEPEDDHRTEDRVLLRADEQLVCLVLHPLDEHPEDLRLRRLLLTEFMISV